MADRGCAHGRRGVNSLVFEIRFPAAFPHAPPFFRILKPRFLPFSQVCAISSFVNEGDFD